MLHNNKKFYSYGFLFPIPPVSGYILSMPEPKNSRRKAPAPPPAPETVAGKVSETVAKTVAERYLDLWQDNIRFWAAEPPAPPEDKE